MWPDSQTRASSHAALCRTDLFRIAAVPQACPVHAVYLVVVWRNLIFSFNKQIILTNLAGVYLKKML